MPRADLLALSPDDLAALTNRGTVKRAQRELEAGEVKVELQETDDGTVTAKSSDGVVCRLPGGAVVAAGRCSCPATELCRHIVRTVLAYQAQAKEESGITATTWDPGTITDDVLAKLFKPAVLTQARSQFQGGLLVELVRSAKPTARFHDLACTLRFQVPGDGRYVHCDCAAAPPCVHVPLAIWAFRRLPPDRTAGVLSTQDRPLPTPADVLDQLDDVLLALLESGLAGAGGAWRDRVVRLEARCRDVGLIWPADVLAEIVHQFERYTEHDARFSPDRVAELAGELLIRSDAIRGHTGAVPQPFVRGTAADRGTDLASARFVGLGCGVRSGRRSATLTAFLQDADSGSMVAVCREFPDPAADSTEPAKPFWQLAQTPALKGATFAQLGAGQLLTQGGRRATDHQLVLGRAKATVNPQNFSWENLRAPVLVEGFAEVRARLAVLPPSALRPRRVAEDFHVCRVTGAEAAAFVPGPQVVQATIRDDGGDTAILRHPFTSRGGEGSERLLNTLRKNPESIEFVAGPMRLTADGLVVGPVAIVVRDASRVLVQPWVDRFTRPPSGLFAGADDATEADPVADWNRRLLGTVGDLFLTGLRRVDPGVLRSVRQLGDEAAALGMARIAAAVGGLADGLTALGSAVDPDPRPAGRSVLNLAVLARLAQEAA